MRRTQAALKNTILSLSKTRRRVCVTEGNHIVAVKVIFVAKIENK
jgi:hypothetical protein